MWNIRKIVSKGDYDYAVVPEHPKASKWGYVLLHRIVLENYLERMLEDDEIPHHTDENKKNNDIENIELCLKKIHSRYHALKHGRKMARLKCPQCKKIFDRYLNKTFLQQEGKYSCCSPSCRGKFSRLIQLNGETEEIKKAINENLLLTFNSKDYKVTIMPL